MSNDPENLPVGESPPDEIALFVTNRFGQHLKNNRIGHSCGMSSPGERLREARERAGYDDPSDAARAMGMPESTYFAHENGNRGITRSAARYADFYRVSIDWLVRGKGDSAVIRKAPLRVALVGYVSAGSELFLSQDSGHLDEVDAPQGASDKTVACEIRGDSLGTFFNRWLVFYDDVRRPVSTSHIGHLCVVGLVDGRILVKKIAKSRSRGRYHLLSQNDEPIMDAEVEWSARVISMTPR